MLITDRFVAATIGRSRYLFFVLYQDYNDFDRAFIRELDIDIERLARNLGENGVVVRPFRGDVDSTRNEVSTKEWTQDELVEIRRTPSMLVIDCDFAEFSPRTHSWILFCFGEGQFGSPRGLAQLDQVMQEIAHLANDATSDTSDLFRLARKLSVKDPDLAKVFTARPGVFGFSIDLMEVGQQFSSWIRNRGRPVGHA